jgi:hypothetical protein
VNKSVRIGSSMLLAMAGLTILLLLARSPAMVSAARVEQHGVKTVTADGINWTIEPADAPPMFSASGQRSMAIDGDGRLHVAYGRDHLYYARQDGDDTWYTQIVDDGSWVGAYASLALAPTAPYTPHISYYDRYGGNLMYAWWNGSGWQHVAVDSTEDVGQYTSLVLDDTGSPHVSYFDYTNNRLKYAWLDGSTWLNETVDGGGRYTSLVLDGSGNPHISYHTGSPDYSLKHAWLDGTTWLSETVDSSGYAGEYNSLALDTSGNPRISYYDRDNGRLKYAWFDGVTWQDAVVDSESYAGRYTSLALDDSGQPRISYCLHHSLSDLTCSDLRYAWLDGTTWLTTTVDNSAFQTGNDTSLALDSSGTPHISYRTNMFDYRLKHAWLSGTTWVSETVDIAGDVGQYSSVALDSSGNPRVAYHAEIPGYNLKYAWLSGTTWMNTTVDESPSVGYYASLALDSSDDPYVSHCTAGSFRHLKVAWLSGTTWLSTTVDTEECRYTSLALDDFDRPHVAYSGEGGLKYAWYNGTTWLSTTVDSNYRYVSLALDDSGVPRISYWDGGQCLKYAWLSATTWLSTTVNCGEELGQDNSLALDASGTPHISYHDVFNGDLKYAWLSGTTWLSTTVDSRGDVGGYSSLALDSQGVPHIGYVSYYENVVKYAWLSGTTWLSSTVATYGEIEDTYGMLAYTSLALDCFDNPHISYYDEMIGDLMVARGQRPGQQPTLRFGSTTCSAGEGAGVATINVILNAPVTRTVAVDYATVDGTALAGHDYLAASGRMTFTPGSTLQTFEVPILDDALDEEDETIELALSSPSGAAIVGGAATLTILDDDVPEVRFSSTAYAVNEAGSAAAITVVLDVSSTWQTVTVDFATGDGTAVAPDDYQATSGTLAFVPGETAHAFIVAVNDDALAEPNETITVALSDVQNGVLGTNSFAVLTIFDDETPSVSFDRTGYTVDEGAGTAVVTVTLRGGPTHTVSVNCITSDGTATSPGDYGTVSSTLTFTPGETSETCSVPIYEDALDEDDETLTLTLSDPVSANLGMRSSASLTIADNDPLPRVRFSDANYVVVEDAGAAIITVTLGAVSGRTVWVDYATEAGSATAGVDYVTISSTLAIPPATTWQTFTVDILFDTLDEPDETLTLNLVNPVNGTMVLPELAVLTILDDDENFWVYLPLVMRH